MRSRLPSVGFWVALVPSSLLAARLVWEQTALSWERGPQMVGFSLMHSELGIVLVLASFAAMGWVLFTLVRSLWPARRHAPSIVGAAIVSAVLALTFVPYGVWVRAFATKIASGPHAVEFLIYMVALGDVPAVQALLDHGVSVNASGRDGIRPLVAADNAKQPAMREFLVSRGARYKADEP